MVSVIIPIKKLNNWYVDKLPLALKSVLNQTYKDFEVIIEVYDGDVAEGRNLGISRARGDRILTLDADDELEPEFLEETVKIDADIVATDGYADGKYFKCSDESFSEWNRILNCSLFKKKVWEANKFDETLGGLEDYDFWYQALKRGFTLGLVHEPLVIVCQGERNKEATKRIKEIKAKIWSKS